MVFSFSYTFFYLQFKTTFRFYHLHLRTFWDIYCSYWFIFSFSFYEYKWIVNHSFWMTKSAYLASYFIDSTNLSFYSNYHAFPRYNNHLFLN
jgi:hypothetical protein